MLQCIALRMHQLTAPLLHCTYPATFLHIATHWIAGCACGIADPSINPDEQMSKWA